MLISVDQHRSSLTNRTKWNGTNDPKKDENGTICSYVSYSSVQNGMQSLFWCLTYSSINDFCQLMSFNNIDNSIMCILILYCHSVYSVILSAML